MLQHLTKAFLSTTKVLSRSIALIWSTNVSSPKIDDYSPY
ncbi:hypothetical protein XM68_c10758 [Vibrio alginolyticus]|nr:hypothetical protein XM68_c10758 [Vibrio alginolyticus]